jgi:4,5-dihydroxyphthalate decarboxylase
MDKSGKATGSRPPLLRRRDVMKGAATAATAAAVGLVQNRQAQAQAAESARSNDGGDVKVAGYDYDRVRAIMDGQVGIPGVKVSFHYEDIYAVNQHAFGTDQKYEVSELGLIPFITKFSNNDFRGYSLVPVFISRVFRHRNVFVHADSGIERPEDLAGRRVGTPGYGMSANTWIRGFLLDEYGIKAGDMNWIETTKSSDKGALTSSGWSAFEGGKSPYFLPDDFPLVQGPPDVDESELLLTGGCDALVTAITPRAFLDGHPKIRRLFPDVRAAEQAYFKKTGLFPIMHVVGIRNDAIEANPELPRAVFQMYSEAKRIAYANLETTTSLKVTLPWVTQEFEDSRKLMGKNYWPYGIEANRKELEHVMRYTHEQGLAKRRLSIEEVFHPSTLSLIESET